MIEIQTLRNWLADMPDDCLIGVDEGGLTLRVVNGGVMEESMLYEIGGIPAHIEFGGTLEDHYARAMRCDPSELQLVHVQYGKDDGLVSLVADLLLASSVDTSTFSVPSGVPRIVVNDYVAEAVFGLDHSWDDVRAALVEGIDWHDLYVGESLHLDEDTLRSYSGYVKTKRTNTDANKS